MDLSECKRLAVRLRAGTRIGPVIELCDAVIALKDCGASHPVTAVSRKVAGSTPASTAKCLVCEARKVAHAALMKKRREEKRNDRGA